MNRLDFEKLIAEQFPEAVGKPFRDRVKNVAFLVEEGPSQDVRQEEQLAPNETLLGLYRGIPHIRRGDHYGIGPTVPDVIVLFRGPIHDEAQARTREESVPFDEALRRVVRETIWHEVAHYLGLGEAEVRARERDRKEQNKKEVYREEDVKAIGIIGALHGALRPLNRLLPKQEPGLREQPLDPITIEQESPELIEKMHQPLIPSEKLPPPDSEGSISGESFQSLPLPESPRNEPPDNLPM